MLKQEGYDLVGAALEVYHTQGGGLGEEIYQESLELELMLRKIVFDSKKQLNVFYKGTQLNKFYIPDLFVFNAIMTELKSVKNILPEHRAQLLNYMRLTNSKVGYLFNFGPMEGLQWERFVI